MGDNKPRRHHSIPIMLLKNFCGDEGKLWVWDKKTRKIFQSTPRNVFVEKDLYTGLGNATASKNEEYFGPLRLITPDYKYEKFLNVIENEAAPVIQYIIREARDKKTLKLSLEDYNKVKEFIMALARRTVESQERVSPVKNFEDDFYKVSTEAAEKENIVLPDRDSFYNNPNFRSLSNHIKSNGTGKFAAGVHPHEKAETEKFCRERGFDVVVIQNPKRSFVIGSHGITIMQNTDKSETTWVPISHDVILKVKGSPDLPILYLLTNDRYIRVINNATFQMSQIVASRSKTLLESLCETNT